MARQYLSATTNASRVLGQQLAAARRTQRRTADEVAERVGTSRPTLRRIERGDPTVAIGLYFEVAVVLSVPLFGLQGAELAELAAQGARELALLPNRVRSTTTDEVDDAF
jgi:transcriptional regulator with XRE-family HTH domain